MISVRKQFSKNLNFVHYQICDLIDWQIALEIRIGVENVVYDNIHAQPLTEIFMFFNSEPNLNE